MIRAYDAPGRSIFFRLKTSEGIRDLSICLDAPNQGIMLSGHCVEIEKNSLIVRALNRQVINSRLVGVELGGKEEDGQFDRVVRLHFVLIDEYFGHRSDFYVFCEFTGRIADAFLCDSEFKISDRISRTSNNLVGGEYKLPDSCRLLSIKTASEEELKKAFSGVMNSDDKVFYGANYIIVPTEKNTKEGIDVCREIGLIMHFGKISILTPEEHDEMIGFVSQLTHCIAVSLMNVSDNEKLVDYVGDSFRDLTRIAKINENMWSELFLLNKDALLKEMDKFIAEITDLRDKLEAQDTQGLKDKMIISTARRKGFDKR